MVAGDLAELEVPLRRCRACGKMLVFAAVAPGRNPIPLVEVEHPFRAVYRVFQNDQTKAVRAEKLSGRLWGSHFENCTNPNRFSKTKAPES